MTMNLATLARNLVLTLLLILCQIATAQAESDHSTLHSTLIDSLIQYFIDQNSVALTSNEAAGVYTYSTGFWLESVVLKDDGRFRVVGSGQLDKSLAKRGTWQLHENKVVLKGRTGKEQIAYIVKYNNSICLLTNGVIEEWKAIAERTEVMGGKLIYNPFRGKVSLYRKEQAKGGL